MHISMKNLEQLSLCEMEDLLAGSQKLTWKPESIEAKYGFIAAVLNRQSYSRLAKKDRGIVRAFLQKTAAISASVTSSIGMFPSTLASTPCER